MTQIFSTVVSENGPSRRYGAPAGRISTDVQNDRIPSEFASLLQSASEGHPARQNPESGERQEVSGEEPENDPHCLPDDPPSADQEPMVEADTRSGNAQFGQQGAAGPDEATTITEIKKGSQTTQKHVFVGTSPIGEQTSHSIQVPTADAPAASTVRVETGDIEQFVKSKPQQVPAAQTQDWSSARSGMAWAPTDTELQLAESRTIPATGFVQDLNMSAFSRRTDSQPMDYDQIARNVLNTRHLASKPEQGALEAYPRIQHTSKSPSNEPASAQLTGAKQAPTLSVASAQHYWSRPTYPTRAHAPILVEDASNPVASDLERLHFDIAGNTGGTPSNVTATNPQALTRTDIVRGLVQQFQLTAKVLPDKPIDVSLNPEELGRVKLSVTANNGAVVLHILAERIETLDLMRRHADALAEELAGLGFETLDLSFGHGTMNEKGFTGGNVSPHSEYATPEETEKTALTNEGSESRLTLQMDKSSGLDIRV